MSTQESEDEYLGLEFPTRPPELFVMRFAGMGEGSGADEQNCKPRKRGAHTAVGSDEKSGGAAYGVHDRLFHQRPAAVW